MLGPAFCPALQDGMTERLGGVRVWLCEGLKIGGPLGLRKLVEVYSSLHLKEHQQPFHPHAVLRQSDQEHDMLRSTSLRPALSIPKLVCRKETFSINSQIPCYSLSNPVRALFHACSETGCRACWRRRYAAWMASSTVCVLVCQS